MSDTPTPFAFKPAPARKVVERQQADDAAPAVEQQQVNRSRGRKKAAETAKPARKPRAAMLPLAILPALAGMKQEEVEALSSIVTELQAFPKGARARIVAALARVFK